MKYNLCINSAIDVARCIHDATPRPWMWLVVAQALNVTQTMVFSAEGTGIFLFQLLRPDHTTLATTPSRLTNVDLDMPTCVICAKGTTLRCPGCKQNYYCSKECFRSDWPTHKKWCNKPLLCSHKACGKPATVSCEACNSSHYCSIEHQTSDSEPHAVICGKLP